MQRFFAWLLLPPIAAVACGNDRDPTDTADAALVSSSGDIEVCDTCGACDEVVNLPPIAHHVDGKVNYPDPPPAGGDHNICWAIWGIHTDAVPAERWVHNLEHGGIVFLYNCPDDCGKDAAALSAITAFVGRHQQALITRYDGMTKKFAAVSWGHRFVSNCIDPQAAAAFYAVHVDRAPESITSNPDPSCD
jgi:Protein of unknown function (DUF3105)